MDCDWCDHCTPALEQNDLVVCLGVIEHGVVIVVMSRALSTEVKCKALGCIYEA